MAQPPNPHTDPALARDASDPEEWLTRHGDALYRYALMRGRDSALAEDLVQETLLAALRARRDFAGRSAERTWLISILRHKLIDHLRRHAREQILDEPLDDDEVTDALFDSAENHHWQRPPQDWANPSAALEQKQFWLTLSECLEALPPRQAQVFALCEIDGLTGGEACKVLDLSSSNLWVMLHRARLRLRQCLESNWFDRRTEG